MLVVYDQHHMVHKGANFSSDDFEGKMYLDLDFVKIFTYNTRSNQIMNAWSYNFKSIDYNCLISLLCTRIKSTFCFIQIMAIIIIARSRLCRGRLNEIWPSVLIIHDKRCVRFYGWFSHA